MRDTVTVPAPDASASNIPVCCSEPGVNYACLSLHTIQTNAQHIPISLSVYTCIPIYKNTCITCCDQESHHHRARVRRLFITSICSSGPGDSYACISLHTIYTNALHIPLEWPGAARVNPAPTRK